MARERNVMSRLTMRLGAAAATVMVVTLSASAQALTPNDPGYPSQWGLARIGGPAAWDVSLGSSVVIVAMVGTGINWTHVDAPLHYRADLSIDLVNGDSNPMDDNGHGTHMAGIVAARFNNGVGVASVAPEVGIVGIKVLNASGSGSLSNVVAGIRHAIDRGARIVCMTFGTPTSTSLRLVVEEAAAAGVLVVAPAGDEASNVAYPAAYPSVVAVGAITQTAAKATFSNFGDALDLMAPGLNVLSTHFTGYTSLSGTSIAGAHVCGVAALVWSQRPDMTAPQVRAILESSAEDLGAPGRDNTFGFGLVRADLALAAVPPPATPVPASGGGWSVALVLLLGLGSRQLAMRRR
jgi:subtilisin family serine protease